MQYLAILKLFGLDSGHWTVDTGHWTLRVLEELSLLKKNTFRRESSSRTALCKSQSESQSESQSQSESESQGQKVSK